MCLYSIVSYGFGSNVFDSDSTNHHQGLSSPSVRVTPNYSTSMALLSSILGFSLFGLSARMGQLGIQKRNLLESTSSFLFPTFA
jgi:hypothetical protein